MQQLLKDLQEVYRNNLHEVGKVYETRFSTDYTLLPLYHILNKTHIEVHLNKNGEFLRAKVGAKMIPMPVTEKSLSRGFLAPHFLHDKLVYLCKDILDYTENNKLNGEEHKLYINQLSKFDNYASKAVYHYLTNNSLIKDLLFTGILFLDENNKFLQKSNGNPIFRVMDSTVENLFVRFHVESESPEYLWYDKEFFNILIDEIEDKFLYQEIYKEDFCYVLGEKTQVSNSFPYKIRHVGDLSRLITHKSITTTVPYIDRLYNQQTSTKAIGLKTSFEAHNALSWLIAKQGIEMNGLVYLLWSNQKKEDLIIDSGFDFIGDYNAEEDDDLSSLTNDTLSKRILNQALGLSADIDTDEEIMFLVLDAFDRTKGALAVLEYQRFKADKFIEKIKLWTNHAKYFTYFHEENTNSYKLVYKSPSIFDILSSLNVQKNFYKMLYRLMLPTFIEGKEMPSFIIKSLREKLMKYRVSNIYHWNDIARCYFSCIKYNKFLKGESLSDFLEDDNKSKDYLAGRLFAYMTYLEDSLAIKKFQKFNPALKYQNIFFNNTDKIKNHTYVKNVMNRANLRNILTEEDEKIIKEITSELTGNNLNTDNFYIGYLHQYDKLKGVNENVKE